MTKEEKTIKSILYFGLAQKKALGIIAEITKRLGYSVEVRTSDIYEHIHFLDLYAPKGKVIGTAECQATFPSITFDKGQRRHAKIFEKEPEFIAPIKGVHQLLDWHTVKGKLHCLSGGQTVLHLEKVEPTDEEIQTQYDLIISNIEE